MKRWFPGLASAAIVIFLFPNEKPISVTWAGLMDLANGSPTATDSVKIVDPEVLDAPAMAGGPDTLGIPADPFGLPPEPANPSPRSNGPSTFGAPPPPRIWRATGRVGERAAVLTALDGRILVVSDGSSVDSATVVSIGNDGVVLEDRAGRFNLRIP